MALCTIDGKTYDLRLDINAMEQIEREFGDLKEALGAFMGKGRNIRTIRAMFRILANSGRKHAGLPPDVTGEEIGGGTLRDLDRLAQAMNQAMKEAMHTETTAGNEADEETYDEYLAELERREKNG